MTTSLPLQCLACDWLDRSHKQAFSDQPLVGSCAAFPQGIPDVILAGADHRSLIGGEADGIRFAMADDEAEAFQAWQRLYARLGDDVKGLKRTYVRDDDGQFAEVPGSGALDKLKLASRIELGEGERLLSSRKFKSSESNSWDLLAAEVDTPAGREIRLGIIYPDNSRGWRGAPAGDAALARQAELEAQRDDLDEDDPRFEELSEELDALRGETDGLDKTVVVSPAAVASMRSEIEAAATQAQAWVKETDAFWDGPHGQRYSELVDIRDAMLGPDARRPSFRLSDDQKRALAEAQARFDAEHGEELRRLDGMAPDNEPVFAEGMVPAGAVGDLAYEVEGNDSGEWYVKFGIRPRGEEDPWHIGQNDDAARFLPKDVKALLAGLAELAGDQSKAATGQRLSIKRSSTGETMQLKSFHPEVKAVGDNGAATIAIATLNVVDKDGDVTLPGFFGEQHAQMVPVHDWNHVPIGKGRVYEKGNQALVDVKFNLAIPEAKNWYEAIKFDKENPPSLQQYSYGYEVLDGGSRQGNFKGRAVRYLTPRPDGSAGGKVFEFSPVLLGAGEGTGTVDVKSLARQRIAERKARTGSVGLYQGGVAPHETATVARSWDGVKTVAALAEDLRPSQLRSVYAWVDPAGDPELKASYKFPHHHGVAGPANIRACLAGIAALNGATGGVDLSDADRKSVYDHLASHLKDADREPPALRTDVGIPSGKNLRFGDEAANVLAGVAGLIDRASDVMAIRRTKGKGMAPATADLLSWVSDELIRLKSLLEHPIEAETPQPDDSEVAAVLMAATAAVHGI